MTKQISVTEAALESMLAELEEMLVPKHEEPKPAAPVAAEAAPESILVVEPPPLVPEPLKDEPEKTVVVDSVEKIPEQNILRTADFYHADGAGTITALDVTAHKLNASPGFVIPPGAVIGASSIVTTGVAIPNSSIGLVTPGVGTALESTKVTERRIIVDTKTAEAPPKTEIYDRPTGQVNGLNYLVDPKVFQEDTLVHELNIDEAMTQQSAMRAFYGRLAALAQAQESQMKAKLEVIEAKLYVHHRAVLQASGEKVTDKAVEAAVKTDERWLRARTMYADAIAIAETNRSLTFALADRRDMLIQLAQDRRGEKMGQLRLLENNGRPGQGISSIDEHRQRVAQLYSKNPSEAPV